ncbi:MAG: hypothetical protein D6816_05750 [Bacteroidetes bacterium]|nr:MAG: hypothetical protein D6816_05750 [Bacteroidota bacterium]
MIVGAQKAGAAVVTEAVIGCEVGKWFFGVAGRLPKERMASPNATYSRKGGRRYQNGQKILKKNSEN